MSLISEWILPQHNVKVVAGHKPSLVQFGCVWCVAEGNGKLSQTDLTGRNKSKTELTLRNWMMNRLTLNPAGTNT